MARTAACFAAVLLGLFGSEGFSHAQGEMFGNMTYLIEEGGELQPVRLVNGEYRSPTLCVYYEGDAVRGDFNRDGLEDAAVVLYESGGGSGYFLSLAFLIHDGTQLVHRRSCSLDPKTSVTSLAARRGRVMVDLLVPDPREGRGRFPMRVRKAYDYASSH